MNIVRSGFIALIGLFVALGCSGCLVVGYRSGRGGFIFPGGLGLVAMVLLVLFLLRRR